MDHAVLCARPHLVDFDVTNVSPVRGHMLTRRQCSSKCPSRLEVDTGRLSKESFTKLSFCETSKASNVSNNFIERSDSQFSVARNSDVVRFVTDRPCKRHVAAARSDNLVAEPSNQQIGEFTSRQVARQLHTAIASSLTRCRRITLGDSSSSK